MHLLESDKTILSGGEAEHPGELRFSISSVPDEKKGWVEGITDYLICGLSDLEHEYPREIKVEMHLKESV